MSKLGKYTRRAFFTAAGGVAVMGLGIFTTQAVCAGSSRTKKLAEQLLDILPHEEAKLLGQRFLQQSGWTDRKQLVAELLRDILPSSRDKVAASGTLGKFVEQKSREDFADRRVVDLDGWILSDTEAKLCALYALDDAHA